MLKKNLYNNICQSVVKFCNDFREQQLIVSGLGDVDWDAHSQLSELPAGSLLGPAGIALAHEEENIQAVFSIGVTIEDDPNLFKLRRVMSELYDRLQPGQTVPLYEHDTAEPVSWMVLKTPIEITPVSKSETRSVQFINCVALVDPGATSSVR